MSLEWIWVGALSRGALACDRPPVSLRARGERLQRPRPARKDIATHPGLSMRRPAGVGGASALEPFRGPLVDLELAGACIRASVRSVRRCLDASQFALAGRAEAASRESSAIRSESICAKVAAHERADRRRRKSLGAEAARQRGVRAPNARMGAQLSRTCPRAWADCRSFSSAIFISRPVTTGGTSSGSSTPVATGLPTSSS